MIRKMLVIAAAIAIPVSTLTALGAVVGTGVAGAKAPVVDPISCTTSGTIDFASGGLSVNGVFTTNKTGTTTANILSAGTGCDSPVTAQPITSKNDKCKVPVSPTSSTIDNGLIPVTEPFSISPPCVANEVAPKFKPTGYYYGLAWSYATGGGTTIATALKHGIVYDDNGVNLTLEVTPAGTTTIDPGGACGSSDAGFQLTGLVKKTTTDNYTLRVCLSTDTGSNVSGSFVTDIAHMVVSPSSYLTTEVDTAVVDPTTSAFSIS
jgi:hypothetical protein